MSDEKPGDENGQPRPSRAEGADAADDAGLTDEQIDAETPGVEDAGELEAAEDAIAAEASEDEDKVVATPTRRRRGRIVADGAEDEDDDESPRTRRGARPAGGATAAGAGTAPQRSRGSEPSAEPAGTRSRAAAERARAAEFKDKRSIGRFLREVVAELRKVIWPGRRELITYTTVVIIFVSFMVALVAGLDVLFAQGVIAVFG
ncbi:preprotein translocase subunit SecE [Modestobacter sp. I12A-02628]|uniref:Protein translocase subunit SecE n=1 Tax=Goekera deserti TaxID=2497753 RepID=A0A7K3W8K1_9ACTN|nr:preprotein translocase subunit SecE [Goekera deserti]MPR00161.1 preprotein translocase subunit SecE [Goekera deserti]NDI49335.1 preprotein translocase subunit SecE [Goekera deserti]NEL52791.1 preprotein translocase subunit SecE [Goekera deserti]